MQKLESQKAEAEMLAKQGKLTGTQLLSILNASNAVAQSQRDLSQIIADEDNKRAKKSRELARQQADEMRKRMEDLKKMNIQERLEFQKQIEQQIIDEMADGYRKQYALVQHNEKWQIAELQRTFDEKLKGISKSSQQYIDAEKLLQEQITLIQRQANNERIQIHLEYMNFMASGDISDYKTLELNMVEAHRLAVYQKMDSFEPTLDDVKESGRPGEDSDIVISLFDPMRFKTTDPSYNVNNFIDTSNGANFFRSVKILKNTYGEDSIRCGMAFMGVTGIFKELPKKQNMEGFDYNNLFTYSYFLEDR
jgi:hypothetical protein